MGLLDGDAFILGLDDLQELKMHSSHYRPTRSNSVLLASLIARKYKLRHVIVHHVIKDTPYECIVQIEHIRNKMPKFIRVTL